MQAASPNQARYLYWDKKIQAYLNAPLPNKSKGAPKGYLKLQTINHSGKQNLQGEVWQAMHCLYIECFK